MANLVVFWLLSLLVLGANADGPNITFDGSETVDGPTDYNNTVYNQLIIANISTSRIQVDPVHFNLSKYDYVLLRDGVNENATLLAQYNDESAPSARGPDGLLFTSGNHLYLTFVPRAAAAANSTTIPFSINVTQLLDGGLYMDSGSISFNSSDNNTTKAFYLMEATHPTQDIRFKPTSIVYPNGTTSRVTCYDGASTSAPIVGVYQANFTAYHSYSYVGNQLLCVAENVTSFTADFSTFEQARRLRGKFSAATSDQCTMVSDPSETIPAQWRIYPQIAKKAAIQLTISSLTLPAYTEGCGTSSAVVYSLAGSLIVNLTDVSTFPYVLYADVDEGVWISSNQSSPNPKFTAGTCLLSITASYVMTEYIEQVTGSLGQIQSPFYPRGIPQDLAKAWRFSLAPSKTAILNFDSAFGLSDSSYLTVYTYGPNKTYNHVFDLYGNESSGTPDDIYVPNPSKNTSRSFAVYLHNFGNMSASAGFRIDYDLTVDKSSIMSFNKSTSEIPPIIYNPGPNDTIDAGKQLIQSWLVTVPLEDGLGNPNTLNLSVNFAPKPNVTTYLYVVDGARAHGKILYSNAKMSAHSPQTVRLEADSATVTTSANKVLIYYVFKNNETTGNSTGGAFNISIKVNQPIQKFDGTYTYYGPAPYDNAVYNKLIVADIPTSRIRVDSVRLTLSMFDYVLLRDGADENAPLLAQYSNESVPSSRVPDGLLYTTGNTLYIRYVHGLPSVPTTAVPFAIHVTQLVDGGLYRDSGFIGFNSSKYNTTKAFYLMEATDPTQIIGFNFNSIVYPNGTSRVTCYDGVSADAPVVGVYQANLTTYYSYSYVGNQLLCVAENVTSFMAYFSTFDQGDRGKFSAGTSDQYTMVSDPSEVNPAYWRIYPIGKKGAIHLTIQSPILKTVPADTEGCGTPVTAVYSLTGQLIVDLTGVTTFPYILYANVDEGVWISSNQSSLDPKFAAGTCLLSITASYVVTDYIEQVTSSSGQIQSPFYPRGIPQDLAKAWRFSLAPSKTAVLNFDSAFGLSNSSYLAVYTYGPNKTYNHVFDLYGNESSGTPDDIYVPNPSKNTSLSFAVYLNNFGEMSASAGFRIDYNLTVDHSSLMNYNSTSKIPPIVYRPGPNDTIDAGKQLFQTWLVTVPLENSMGNLNTLNLTINFVPKPNVTTSLYVFDGARDHGKTIYSNVNMSAHSLQTKKLEADSATVMTSANKVLIYYVFKNNKTTGNSTGGAFNISITVNPCEVCNVSVSGLSVKMCLRAAWRCDGLYQCLDGRDEYDCGATPSPQPGPTPKPASGVEPWKLGVGIVFAFIGGIIIAIIAVVCIAKRRGNYSRLHDMMAPVPA